MKSFYTTLTLLLLLPGFILPAGEQLSSDPLLESARSGNVRSQLLLADAFFFGRNRKINPALAVYWYRKAAENGSVQAQYNLGVCLEQAWGCRRSLIGAFAQYKKAADKNLLPAIIRYAELLYTGTPDEPAGKITVPGIQPDPEKALSLLRSKTDSPEICHALAVLLLKDIKNLKSNAEEIRTCLEKAAKAEKPQTETLLHLASVLQNGIGGPSDQKRAADLLETAALRNHPAAMTRYGKLLEHGFGRKPDPERAISLYRRAAEKNHPAGMFELARHLKSGFYISADLAQAFKLFKESAQKGYAPAFAETGDCFRYGYGVASSPEQAFDWYMRGARAGVPDAQLKVGECYRLGISIPEDPAGAVYWYKKAAENGNAEALRRLAIAFLTGYGVKKNISTGSQLLKTAAANGDKEAEKLLIQWSN